MRRVALALAIVFCAAVGGAQAHEFHHGHHHGHFYRPIAPVVVARPVVSYAVPAVVAPYPPVYGAYGYGCYHYRPAYGVYYQGRGLSIGVGF